nr:MAG TPA: hypothetical protein [Caudoviricetes sp.]
MCRVYFTDHKSIIYLYTIDGQLPIYIILGSISMKGGGKNA